METPVTEALRDLPGADINYAAGIVRMTIDAALFASPHLGYSAKEFLAPTGAGGTSIARGLQRAERLKTEAPGLFERWDDLRVYQKPTAVFSAMRSYSFMTLDMRLGKCPSSLASAILAGARRTLIIVPSKTARDWLREVWVWTKSEPLLCVGRRGTVFRRYCGKCAAKGWTADEKNCTGCVMRNGSSVGLGLYQRGVDAEEFWAAANEARFIVCPYELLPAQVESDARGKEHVRTEIPGFGKALSRLKFDYVIADETHLFLRKFNRGKSSATDRTSIVDRFQAVTERIPQATYLTGTPQANLVRDWWRQVDLLSCGAVVSSSRRVPFTFHAAYCGGHKAVRVANDGKTFPYWDDSGRSERADTEWGPRRLFFEKALVYADVLDQMPDWQFVVREVEGDVSAAAVARALRGGTTKSKLKKLMMMTAKIKIPRVLEDVLETTRLGEKVIVLAAYPDAVGLFATALAKVQKSRSRVDGLKTWLADGTSLTPIQRSKASEEFREWTGPGVYLTSIKASDVGISLAGASTQYHIDCVTEPGMMLQVARRAFLPGVTRGMTLVFYEVPESIDVRRRDELLPRLEALASTRGRSETEQLISSFAQSKKTDEQLIEEMMSWATSVVSAPGWQDLEGDAVDGDYD